MKTQLKTLATTLCFLMIIAFANAQNRNSMNDKKISLKIGAGYFQPLLNDEGVSYSNATYDPTIGVGVSYFASFDYEFIENFSVGLGYNGNYAKAEFIRNATVNGETLPGFLEAGAVTNTNIFLNLSYIQQGDGIQPFAKLGLGYMIQQLENGDVPLRLTDNKETEIFPDFKASGFGVMPEAGIRYGNFFLSAAYSIPFERLTGEVVPEGFVSPGSVSSQALQINVSYRIFLF